MQPDLHSPPYAFMVCTRTALPVLLPFFGWWRPANPASRPTPEPVSLVHSQMLDQLEYYLRLRFWSDAFPKVLIISPSSALYVLHRVRPPQQQQVKSKHYYIPRYVMFSFLSLTLSPQLTRNTTKTQILNDTATTSECGSTWRCVFSGGSGNTGNALF
jgi:hypothetical protein